MNTRNAALRFTLTVLVLAGFAGSAGAVVNFEQILLRSVSNDTMTTAEHANANLAVASAAKWHLFGVNPDWFLSGETDFSNLPDGAYTFFFTRIPDFYQPDPDTKTWIGVHVKYTNFYRPYSNVLTVAVTGLAAGASAPWTLTAWPAEFTNSSAFALSFSNSATITLIPTGTYALAFPHLAGYSNTESITTNITGAPLIVALTNVYTPYDWSPGSTSTPPVPPPGTLPTNFPAATNPVAVMAWSNGTLAVPTNLWTANASNIAVAITGELEYATGTPVYVESDPVWASEKSGYATGTPVYVESDPVWASEKSGYATGTPVYTESDPVFAASPAGGITIDNTNAWTTAIADLGSVSDTVDLAVANIGGVSGIMDTAIANLAAVSNAFTNHQANGDADVLHLTAAEKAVATNPPDLALWADYNASSNVRWVVNVVTQVLTNLVVTGTLDLDPVVTGTYAYAGETEEKPYWTNIVIPDGFVSCFLAYDPAYSGYYIGANDGISPHVWTNQSEFPVGEHNPAADSTGTATVAYSILTNSITNTISISGLSGTHVEISTNTTVSGSVTATSFSVSGTSVLYGATIVTGAAPALVTNGGVLGITVPAGHVTNQVITYAGTTYTITNDPSAEGDVLYFDPATSNAYFGAAAAGLSLAEVLAAEPLMTNSAAVAIGKDASGALSGVGIGENANGALGVAIGKNAVGNQAGATIGRSANSWSYGFAGGENAEGGEQGVAVGAYAFGRVNAVAVGYRARATNSSVAVGYMVTNPVSDSTRVRGDLYLDGGSNVFVRTAFGSGEFTPLATGGGSATPATFPVFRLPMGGAWTDFELKASTNNFAGLVYFITSMPGVDTIGVGDTNYRAYYQNDYDGDVRKWRLADTNFSIVFQLTNGISTNATTANVFVYPSHNCEVDWTTWMSETNEHLVWSYVRIDEVGPEQNFDGSRPRWNGVLPTWRTVRTSP